MGHCPKGRLSFPIFTARFVLPRPSCKFLASLSYFARCYTSHFSNSASFFWDHHEILSSTIRVLVFGSSFFACGAPSCRASSRFVWLPVYRQSRGPHRSGRGPARQEGAPHVKKELPKTR